MSIRVTAPAVHRVSPSGVLIQTKRSQHFSPPFKAPPHLLVRNICANRIGYIVQIRKQFESSFIFYWFSLGFPSSSWSWCWRIFLISVLEGNKWVTSLFCFVIWICYIVIYIKGYFVAYISITKHKKESTMLQLQTIWVQLYESSFFPHLSSTHAIIRSNETEK